MIVAITMFVVFCVLGIIGYVWQRTRGRKLLRGLRAQQAAGAARAWIDRTYPTSAIADRKTAFVLRQRLCALALIGDVDAVEREVAAIEGEWAWKMVPLIGGLLGIAVKGNASTVTALAKALADQAPSRLTGVSRTLNVPALRAMSGLIDALAGAAPPPAHMIDLQKATAYQPYYRALAWEGMVKVCERAGDKRAAWMKDALAKDALEI